MAARIGHNKYPNVRNFFRILSAILILPRSIVIARCDSFAIPNSVTISNFCRISLFFLKEGHKKLAKKAKTHIFPPIFSTDFSCTYLLLLLLLQEPELWLQVEQLVVGGGGGAAEVLGRAGVLVLGLPGYVAARQRSVQLGSK